MSVVLNQNNINEVINAQLINTNVIVSTVANSVASLVNDKNVKSLQKNVKAFQLLCGTINDYSKTVTLLIKSFNTKEFFNNDELKQVIGQVEAHSKDLDKLVSLIGNDKNNSLFSVVTKFSSSLEKIKEFKLNIIASIKLNIAINTIKNIIGKLIDLVNSEAFKNLEEKELKTRVQNVNAVIIGICNIFDSVIAMIKHSILILMFGGIIRLAMKAIVKIITVVQKIASKKISNKGVKNIANLEKIINSLFGVMKKLTIMIPLSVLALVGMAVTTVFVLALCGFVLLLGLFTKYIRIFIKGVNKGIRRIGQVIGSLMLIGVAILLFAVATPIIVMALADCIVPFIGILLLSMIILWLALKLTNKVTESARTQALKIGYNILMIVMSFLAVAILLIVAGLIGLYLQQEGVIENVILGLSGMILISAIVVLLGMALSAASPWLTATQANMVPLLIVIGLLIVAAVLLVVFNIVGKQLQDGDVILNISIGILATTAVAAGLVGLGMALSVAAPWLTVTTASITPLLIVIGLLVAAGALMIVFNLIGKKLREDDVVTNIGIGLVATAIVATCIVGLGMALTLAAPFLGITTGTLGMVFMVMGILVGSGFLMITLGKLGKQFKENDVITNANITIDGVTSIVWDLAALSFSLTVMMIPLLLATTGITALMILVALVKKTANMLVSLGEVKIPIDDVKTKITDICSFIDAFAEATKDYGFTDFISLVTDSVLMRLVEDIVSMLVSIAEKLNTIQSILIDTGAIKDKISFLFTFVNTLSTDIETMLYGDIAADASWWDKYCARDDKKDNFEDAADHLNNVDKVVSVLNNVATTLNTIQDIKLDETKIKDNIAYLFRFVGDIEKQINLLIFGPISGNMSEDDIEDFIDAQEELMDEDTQEYIDCRLNRVTGVIKVLKTTADVLNSIQNIELDEALINSNLTSLFKFIDSIELKVTDWIFGISKDTENLGSASERLMKMNDNVLQNNTKDLALEQGSERITKVETVIVALKGIIDALKSINEIKIDDDFKTRVSTNVVEIFKFVDELTLKVKNLMFPEMGMGVTDSIDKAKQAAAVEAFAKRQQIANMLKGNDLENFSDQFGKVGEVISVLSDITKALEEIKKFKVTKDDKQKLEDNIDTLFNAVAFVTKKIQENIDTGSEPFDTKKLKPYINGLDELNSGFKKFSETGDTNKFKENVNNFANFVNKVNTINVEKVEKTANLFNKMAEFSKSINGDFDKLTEALTEKLLPVLEELKEVMVTVPEKIDSGFKNTNASIGAQGNLATSENIEAQIKRENPDISDTEIKKESQRRMEENAKKDKAGIEGKLDELIKLFKGGNKNSCAKVHVL